MKNAIEAAITDIGLKIQQLAWTSAEGTSEEIKNLADATIVLVSARASVIHQDMDERQIQGDERPGLMH